MRMIDDIRNEHWNELGPRMQEIFREAQVLVCDDVTEYFFALNDKEYWKEEDFPNVAPPFQSFWMETKHPSKITSEECGVIDWKDIGGVRPQRWGAIFHQIPKNSIKKYNQGADEFYTDEDLKQFHWLLSATLFVQRVGYDIFPMWAWSIPITKDGALWMKYDPVLDKDVSGLSYSLQPHIKKLIIEGDKGQEAYQSHRSFAHTMMHPFLLSLCFMHCKNVELKTVLPPFRLAKKHARMGRYIHAYRTIEVGPIKRIINASQLPGETGIKMAVHRCRGHFKTYTKERPLLGHAVGTYFWEEHVRGTSTKGQVRKEYEVKP